MSERDDMNEQAYQGPIAIPIDAYEEHLNRMAQRFYEASGLTLHSYEKRKVVAGLRAVFQGSGRAAVPAVPDDITTLSTGTLRKELKEAEALLVIQAEHAGRLTDEIAELKAAAPAPEVISVPDRVYGAEQALDFMLGQQHEIESVWGRNVDPTDPEAVSTYIREVILCAEDELHEVLAEVHWKPWKDARGIKDIAKYRGEMADVLHFILDLYLAGGITGREIIADYMAKHYENLQRNKSLEYRAS